MTATQDFLAPATRAEKQHGSHHLWQSGDIVRHRSNASRTGTVLHTFDRWVWVCWKDAATIKGCWKPETEEGCELEFVDEACELCGNNMGDEEGRVHQECCDRENADISDWERNS